MQPFSERPAAYSEARQPDTRLDLGRFLKAKEQISRVFRDTPQFDCPALGNLLGCEEQFFSTRLDENSGAKSIWLWIGGTCSE